MVNIHLKLEIEENLIRIFRLDKIICEITPITLFNLIKINRSKELK